MAYRLTRYAGKRLATILAESARRFGQDAADRYEQLVVLAIVTIGSDPENPAAQRIPGCGELRAYHLRHVRRSTPIKLRVSRPRHLVIYRVGTDGAAEILGFAHDRQLLRRTARRARHRADD